MPRQTNKQNSYLLSDDGEWLTVGPVVVSRYTQTIQRWLRVKIVKSGHGRHYKEAFAEYKKKVEQHNNNSKYYGILKT